MAKYQGAYREDVYKEEMPAQQEIETEELDSVDSEEGTFKKRYGDLRRHMQQMMQQKESEGAEHETAEGNEIEAAEHEVEEETMDVEEEDDDEDLYPSEPGQFAYKPSVRFAVMSK